MATLQQTITNAKLSYLSYVQCVNQNGSWVPDPEVYTDPIERNAYIDALEGLRAHTKIKSHFSRVLKYNSIWANKRMEDILMKAFQDYYPDDYSHCYGCGRLNKDGYHIKSYWDGEESVCSFDPRHYHTGGFPDYLYGGLIASVVDCHSAATAAAAGCRADGLELGQQPLSRYVTASLKVDYLKPTPVKRITLRSNVVEIKQRKVVVETSVFADDDILRAKGEAIMVKIPE